MTMIEKPSNFNANDNYTSLKAARKANKNWFKSTKQYYYKQYKVQIKDPSLTAEQRSHIFDHYQQNLDACQRQYKQNNTNIKFHFGDVKTKVSKNIQHKTLTAKKTGTGWKQFIQIIKNKQVLAGIGFTVFLLVVFHIGSIITVPGISIPGQYTQSSDFAGMLNLLAGGGLTHMSFFAIGVGPYITSQIIVQLLSSDLIPPLSRLSKQGERGKRKLEIINRVLTLPFCFIQAYAVMALILSMNNSTPTGGAFSIFGKTSMSELSGGEIFGMMMILTGGAYVSIFFGDMITKRGVGNGITVIILAGILSNLFGNFSAVYQTIASKFSQTESTYMLAVVLTFLIYILFYFLVLLIVTFINSAIRKIPIQQTGEGLTHDVKNLPYLPIKFNSAGVIPVIFASSIMTIPSTIAQFLSEGDAKWVIQDYFTLESWSGMSLYFIFIILFTFFYSYVQINPQQLQENFEKSGKFIPGVKSGEDTSKHITKVLSRVNWLGGPFLAVIATLPYFVSKLSGIPSGLALGGTGIIIIVSASIEIWNSIKSALTNTGYEQTRKTIQAKYFDDQNKNDNSVEELW